MEIIKQTASARTFGFEKDVTCRSNGLALGGSLQNVVVGDHKILNKEVFASKMNL